MTFSVNGQGAAAGSDASSATIPGSLQRASELKDLLNAVQGLVLPFVQGADSAASNKKSAATASVLVNDAGSPAQLVKKLGLLLPNEGHGKAGLLEMIEKVLEYSVNTWDQGFLDKLYSTNTPVGVVSDLVLSVLNTNLHVYQVSPALTIIEKTTAKALANLFGFDGPYAGGFTCQGGSSSNLTSLVAARNTLNPVCKTAGNANHDFAVFTSAHGHYSVEKSAMICGMGSDSVWAVPADDQGRMQADALRDVVLKAKAQGKKPLYVNATAGTTVLGSFDPFEDISRVCKEFGMWMHIDASWGGPVVFSKLHREKVKGSHLADSITVNPHKMMNVPTTCSFILGPDVRLFNAANSTSAGYLFHDNSDEEIWDLADLTLQCGRRGDSLKLALAWLYYGADGFERQIDHAYQMASSLYHMLEKTGNFVLLGNNPPPCLQVCFYYAPGGSLPVDAQKNTLQTQSIVRRLVGKGFMVDYAPGKKGSFIRTVVNTHTLPSTVEALVETLIDITSSL